MRSMPITQELEAILGVQYDRQPAPANRGGERRPGADLEIRSESHEPKDSPRPLGTLETDERSELA
jgi:hypothetical protein